MTERSRPEVVEALRRVLGPSEPELTCDECFAALDVYVDLELNGDNAELTVPGMRAHLEGCPACREDHASLHALSAEPHPRIFNDEEQL